MRKHLVAAALTACLYVAGIGAACAEPIIVRYDDLRDRLVTAAPVMAFFEPEKCWHGPPYIGNPPIKPIAGGFFIRDFMEIDNDMIAFANQHFTVKPEGTPVLEFLQFRVNASNWATITMWRLSPVTYQPLPDSKPVVYRCSLGQGLSFKRASVGS